MSNMSPIVALGGGTGGAAPASAHQLTISQLLRCPPSPLRPLAHSTNKWTEMSNYGKERLEILLISISGSPMTHCKVA